MKDNRETLKPVAAETIARLADQGKDVSRFFTNKGQKTESKPRVSIVLDKKSVFHELALKVLGVGADTVDVDYKGGYEEVCAMKKGIGFGIESIPSSSDRAKSLCKELYVLAKKKKGRVALVDAEYDFQARVYDSFGEDAFQVQLRRT